MKIKIFLLAIVLLAVQNLVSKESNSKKININIKEEGIFVNEEKLSASLKIEDYDRFFGKYDVKESREDGLYYTWDKLGIKLREDSQSKSINQLSIYLTSSLASDTKTPYKGKLSVLSKELNSNSNPTSFTNELFCQQIFCTFKSELISVIVNLTENKKKFKNLIIKID